LLLVLLLVVASVFGFEYIGDEPIGEILRVRGALLNPFAL